MKQGVVDGDGGLFVKVAEAGPVGHAMYMISRG
jgi:hypothetical protein